MIKQRNLDPALQKLLGIAENVSGSLLASAAKGYAADGPADMEYQKHILGSGVDLTGVNPKYIGQLIILACPDSTANATATCGAGITWDGTNDTVNLVNDNSAIVAMAISLTRWLVLVNLGTCTFS
jgi:hypothetical protein